MLEAGSSSSVSKELRYRMRGAVWQGSMVCTGVGSWHLWHSGLHGRLPGEPLYLLAAAVTLNFLLWPCSLRQCGPRVPCSTAAFIGAPAPAPAPPRAAFAVGLRRRQGRPASDSGSPGLGPARRCAGKN